MYGWRARIGLIIGNSNTTAEPEFGRLAPDGVSVHAARMPFEGIFSDGVNVDQTHLDTAAQLLSRIDAKVIAYACTSANQVAGTDSDRQQADRIREVSGTPALTTSAALVEALEVMDARKICVATPYSDDLNESSRAYWTAAGFDLLHIGGVDMGGKRKAHPPLTAGPVSAVGIQWPAAAYNLARLAHREGADAVVLSGANLRSIEIAQSIEDDLGVTFVSSMTATVWASLQMAGVRTPIAGYGRLLAAQPRPTWTRLVKP
jgi:maleate cis-trans isomerase